MRDFNPGDVSVRLSFATVMGSGPDAGEVRPQLQITDGTSRLSLGIKLSAAQLTHILSGSSAEVPADRVTGFKGLARWGKSLKITTRLMDIKIGDYRYRDNPRDLEHVERLAAAMESDGWQCDTPRINNGGQWIIVGRRYDDEP